jgi:hypothetical protein
MKDHRSIPLEVLRDFVRVQAELTSLRAVASAIGVGRTTLHSFLNDETKPHPRIRRLIGLFYIAKMNEAPDIDIIRPYVSALSTLVSALPPDKQGAASALLVDGLAVLHGPPEKHPRWLESLAKGAP